MAENKHAGTVSDRRADLSKNARLYSLVFSTDLRKVKKRTYRTNSIIRILRKMDKQFHMGATFNTVIITVQNTPIGRMWVYISGSFDTYAVQVVSWRLTGFTHSPTLYVSSATGDGLLVNLVAQRILPSDFLPPNPHWYGNYE